MLHISQLCCRSIEFSKTIDGLVSRIDRLWQQFLLTFYWCGKHTSDDRMYDYFISVHVRFDGQEYISNEFQYQGPVLQIWILTPSLILINYHMHREYMPWNILQLKWKTNSVQVVNMPNLQTSRWWYYVISRLSNIDQILIRNFYMCLLSWHVQFIWYCVVYGSIAHGWKLNDAFRLYLTLCNRTFLSYKYTEALSSLNKTDCSKIYQHAIWKLVITNLVDGIKKIVVTTLVA